MNLNLSKFKKIKEDKHSATLKHPAGHHIQIAKHGLSSKMLKEISDVPLHLAEGGMPDWEDRRKQFLSEHPDMPIDQKQSILEDSFRAQGEQQFYNPEKPAAQSQPDVDPYEKEKQAYLTRGEQEKKEQADREERQKSYSNSAKNILGVPQQPTTVINVGAPAAPQGPSQNVSASPAGAPDMAVAQKVLNDPNVSEAAKNEIRQSMGMPSPQAQVAQNSDQIPSTKIEGPETNVDGNAPAPKPQDPYGTEAYYDAYSKGLGAQKEGLQKQAQAEGQLGLEQSKLLQAGLETQQAQQKTFQQHFDELEQERQAVQKDIQNQHITPNHYMSSLGTAGKVSTAIGLILGGLGAGATHGENIALNFLNHQISNDIEAQKANLGKSENLLNANLKQFGNLRDASDMTRLMQMDIVKNQLSAEAAKSQDPLAKARAQQAIGALDVQAAPIMSQMAMRRTLLGGVQSGQTNPSMAIRMLVPEGQQASAYKELKEAQDMSRVRDNMLSAWDRVAELNTVKNRSLSPIQTKSKIKAIKDPIVASLSKETAGRFTEQDAGMLDSLFTDVLDDQGTMSEKRREFERRISEKMNFPILQSYGIRAGNQQGQTRYAPGGEKKIKLGAPVLGSEASK